LIRHLEVDGVPTVLTATSGPMHAGLSFRVGRADETLARSGITHLIEHLALYPLGLADYHYNGVTGSISTSFHIQGSESDITGFLTRVCDSLNGLPVQRMAVEKEILRTEAAGRKSGVTEPLARWRYGARDYGVSSYPEWGNSALVPDDLVAWLAKYFTRDNAVLWIAGDDVPAGLSLRLPSGVRQPPPAVSSALPVTPAYFPGSSRAVAWDTVVAPSAPARVFAAVLEREMFRSLRQEGGLSYTVQTDYDLRGDGMAVITAVADGLPDKLDAVLGGFVDVLATMKVGRIDDDDVKAVVAKGIEALSASDAQAARLPAYAISLLASRPQQTNEQLVEELRKVTTDDVTQAAAEALQGGLLMTPDHLRADWAGFVEAPSTSDTVVTGTSYRSLGSENVTVIVGANGASLLAGDDKITVHYDECAALLAWPDGGRVLIGNDAISLRVEPTLYGGLGAAVPWIDSGVPADRRVELPARDPEEIPSPKAASAPEGKLSAASVQGGRGRAIFQLVVLWPMLPIFGGLALLFTIASLVEPKDRGVNIGFMIFSYAVVALMIVGIVRATRRLRAR